MAPSAVSPTEAYVAAAPAGHRPALRRLLELGRSSFPGSTEVLRYGMPGFERGGTWLAGFASKQQHVAVYVGAGALNAHRTELATVDVGKGCIRFAHPDRIDFPLIEKILRTADSVPAGR